MGIRDRYALSRSMHDTTKFCTSGNPRYNSRLDFEVTPADACCKELANCPNQMPQFTYRYNSNSQSAPISI